jgi:predicted DNA-binding transcriptional regulator YafY
MKSDRLLSALMLLQAHGRLTSREIAERLEISERTAHRDMEALCTAGIPLIAHRGSQGGWELQKGWRTKVPGLDDAELQGLLMVQPSALGDRKLTAAAQRAFDKLMASLPTSMRAQADSIRARLHIDPTGWRPLADDPTMLPVVQNALARNCKLTFLYTRSDGETNSRTVDPLGIVCKQTVWYLIAQNPAGMRTFRVSRIRDAVVLALQFERPAKFDLATYWKQATAKLRDQKQTVSATVALSPEGVLTIDRWCPMTVIPNHPRQSSVPQDWHVFEVEFENVQQARFVILGLGPRAIALAPNPLRKQIAQDLNQMHGLHQRIDPAPGQMSDQSGSPRKRNTAGTPTSKNRV